MQTEDSREQENKSAKSRKWPAFVLLQVGLFIFSLQAVFAKLGGQFPFMSVRFLVFYGLMLFCLFLYAIIWQQVLKKLPLTVAYACKGIGILYGILWGMLFFGERQRPNMLIGACLVLVGIFFFLRDDAKEEERDE